jgi:hypothetical protein
MMLTVMGQITCKEMAEVYFAPPMAVISKVTTKIPSFDVSKAIFRHPTDELGDEHSG